MAINEAGARGRMRLNGWQRIAIVLSVVWFFVGGFWGNSLGLREGEWVSQQYIFCLQHDADPHMLSDEQCKVQFYKAWPEAIKDHWWTALWAAVLPIPIAWLLGYGLIALVRWIWKGGFGTTR